MEEMIQILILAGAMVVAVAGQRAKSKKKPADASPQEVLEDMPPHTVCRQAEEDIPQVRPVRSAKLKRPHANPGTAPRENPRNPHPSAPKQERKYRMDTREEARRAFIHAEIFNRKY